MKHHKDSDLSQDGLSVLITRGAEIFGGFVGLAATIAGANPAIPLVVTPVVSGALEAAANEALQRNLTRRQEARVGSMMWFALQQFEWNRKEGLQIRTDGFFVEQPDDRAAAEEVIEAVILASQQEYAEKKLQLYGRLLANIIFRQDIDRALAQQLTSCLQQLTYRQLCFVSLILTHRAILHSEVRGIRRSKEDNLLQETIKLEVYDLIHRGIILNNGASGFRPEYVEFYSLYLSKFGGLMAELTGLREVMSDDKTKLLKMLPRPVDTSSS